MIFSLKTDVLLGVPFLLLPQHGRHILRMCWFLCFTDHIIYSLPHILFCILFDYKCAGVLSVWGQYGWDR